LRLWIDERLVKKEEELDRRVFIIVATSISLLRSDTAHKFLYL